MIPNYISYDSSLKDDNAIIFESNMLLLLLFFYFMSFELILFSCHIKWGLAILILRQAYDILTSFPLLDAWKEQADFYHSVLKDGSTQVAYIFIAYGLLQLFDLMKETSFLDRSTQFYKRNLLFYTTRRRFSILYFRLSNTENKTGKTQSYLSAIEEFTHILNSVSSYHESAFRLSEVEFVILTNTKKGLQLASIIEFELNKEGVTFTSGVMNSTPKKLKKSLTTLKYGNY